MSKSYKYIFSIYDCYLNISELKLKINNAGYKSSVIKRKNTSGFEYDSNCSDYNLVSYFNMNFSIKEVHMYSILINSGCYLLIIKFVEPADSALINLLHIYEPINIAVATDFFESKYPSAMKNFVVSPDKVYDLIENHRIHNKEIFYKENIIRIFSENSSN